MKTSEKVTAAIILLIVITVCMCPGLIFKFIIFGVTFLLAWAIANMICKMVLNKSLRDVFFGDTDK